MKQKTFSRGFTLIELLVVIAIIAVLATLLILQLNTARAKGRDARRIGDINQIQTAIELYYDECGSYPTDIYAAATTCPGGIGRFMQSAAAPKDPGTAAINYGYGTISGKYQVWAQLELINASAFRSDADISGSTYVGGTPPGTDGSIETGISGKCTISASASAKDCVFDLGIK